MTADPKHFKPKDVIEFAKANDCQFLDIRFMDLPGVWQHYSFPINRLTLDCFENGFGFGRLAHLIIDPAQRNHGRHETRIDLEAVFEHGRGFLPHAGLDVFVGKGKKVLGSGILGYGGCQTVDLRGDRGRHTGR